MPTYPKYYKSGDDLKTFKVVSEGLVTEMVIALDAENNPLKYSSVGISEATESELALTMDEVSAGDWNDVFDDVDDCARVGNRPHIKPH